MLSRSAAIPKNDTRYLWTNHVVGKMLSYRLSPSLVKRVVRFPARVEEGIADSTVAVMKPADGVKRYQEVWVMYQLVAPKKIKNKNFPPKIKIITAWRYPGKSPARDPVPAEIMDEVSNILNH